MHNYRRYKCGIEKGGNRGQKSCRTYEQKPPAIEGEFGELVIKIVANVAIAVDVPPMILEYHFGGEPTSSGAD